ncbi:hypothetical protein [Cysteiniphilum litorale]|uniref:hypothetical protein n=1 Tax=Cysteiniphilum litorale TaxID=2056700 RepID=UPI003F885D0C
MTKSLDKYMAYQQRIRKDPDIDTPEKDKAGFTDILSPSHSLQLLNKYIRTNLIILVHGFYHDSKHILDESEDSSPLEILNNSIKQVLTLCQLNPEIYKKLEPSELHIRRGFVLRPKEDFDHDVKLLKHHEALQAKKLSEIEEF